MRLCLAPYSMQEGIFRDYLYWLANWCLCSLTNMKMSTQCTIEWHPLSNSILIKVQRTSKLIFPGFNSLEKKAIKKNCHNFCLVSKMGQMKKRFQRGFQAHVCTCNLYQFYVITLMYTNQKQKIADSSRENYLSQNLSPPLSHA